MRKDVKYDKVIKLLGNWKDLQRAYDEMLRVPEMYQTSLKKALKLTCIKTEGKEHDGLWDAYNTAELFIRVMKDDDYEFEFKDINTLSRRETHLSGSIGELYDMDFFSALGMEIKLDEINEAENERDWSLRRKFFALVKGEEQTSNYECNKYKFYTTMKRKNLDMVR